MAEVVDFLSSQEATNSFCPTGCTNTNLPKQRPGVFQMGHCSSSQRTAVGLL
ncbi:hypothetical protein DPMN_000069 [Dreissena polymorpha]|uniref:Uncharacterized protein n=1 Tax=Dreissena polymorpha TaxID=45954 RepID=A0A9D4MEP9_DREPO|nr:hypothetical protein DPMN_000069 [Dreissena polymorpha]